MGNHGRIGGSGRIGAQQGSAFGGVGRGLSPGEISRNRCDANLRFLHDAYEYTPPPTRPPAQRQGLLESLRDLAGAVRRNPEGVGEIFRQPIIRNNRETIQKDMTRLYLLNKAQTLGRGRR